MTRSLAATVLIAALGLGLGSAASAAGPIPDRFPVERNAPVLLPPGPCIHAGGRVHRVHGHDSCIVPVVVFEPPDPCLRAHGVMVEASGGRRGCALREYRDPQSGLPTGQRMH